MKSIVEFLVNNHVQPQQKKNTKIEVIKDLRNAQEDDLYKMEYGNMTLIACIKDIKDKGNTYHVHTKWTIYSVDNSIRINNTVGFVKSLNKLLDLTDTDIKMVKEIESMYDTNFTDDKTEDKKIGTFEITGDNVTITWL